MTDIFSMSGLGKRKRDVVYCRMFGTEKGCEEEMFCDDSHDNPNMAPICKLMLQKKCPHVFDKQCVYRHFHWIFNDKEGEWERHSLITLPAPGSTEFKLLEEAKAEKKAKLEKLKKEKVKKEVKKEEPGLEPAAKRRKLNPPEPEPEKKKDVLDEFSPWDHIEPEYITKAYENYHIKKDLTEEQAAKKNPELADGLEKDAEGVNIKNMLNSALPQEGDEGYVDEEARPWFEVKCRHYRNGWDNR